MKKRLLSLALCLALCLGLLPVGVLAADGESGGVYVPPGGQTEGGGGTYIPPEDTRTDDSESKIENSNYIPANKVESNTTVQVIACTEHTWDNNYHCTKCDAKAVASVTKNDVVTYYTNLAEALAHANGGTVKLLNNVPLSECIDIISNCTIDLNSKTISGSNSQTLLNICGNVTICDESTQKAGKVINSSSALDLQNGKLTIKGGTFEATHGNALSATSGQLDAELSIEGGTFKSKVDISDFSSCISGGTFHYLYNANVIADLLKDGYGFKKINGSWLSANDLGKLYAQNVTVVLAPISGITVKSYKDTYSYGEDVTLTANASSDTSTHPTYQWYRIRANTTKDYDISVTSVDDATNPTCVLTDLAPNYMINGHTYKSYLYYCAATYGDYATGRSVQFTVTKADLSNATVKVTNPTYNGNPQKPIVTVKMGEKVLVENTDYTVNVTQQANVRENDYTLTINGTGNYTGKIKNVKWNIAPMKIDSFMVSSDISKDYDGTAAITKTPEEWAKVLIFKTLSAYDIVNVPSDAYTISDASFIENRNGEYFNSPDAGEKYGIFFKITLKSSNYVLQNYYDDEPAKSKEYAQSGAATFIITKAPALDTQTGTLTVANNHKGTYTFDLKALLPTLEAPKSYGSISYGTPEVSLSSGYYSSGAEINDGVLSLPIQANPVETTGKIGTVKVVVTTTNYKNITLTLNVSAANKTVPTGTPTLSKTNLTYGDKLSDITLSGSMKDGDNEVAGTFTWENPNEILTAGKHQAGWVFTPTDSAHYIEVTGESEVTVAKATPTGTPSYTAITESGKTLEDAHLAVGTIQPEGFIQWVDADGKEINVSTEVKANTAYTWKFMPDDKENYNTLTGTITLWHKSSSGSSSGSVTPGTKTDTVKNPDGSTTKTETKADGSKTETTTASSGGGSTGITVTKTDSKGNTTTEASAKLSDRDVKEAQEKGEAVTVPVKGIAAAKDANAATKIKIDVPNNANKTTVEIPVENVTSGTVAVIVHEDGTEELVKDSKPTEHGVQLELSGSTTVKIIDNSKTFDDTKDHWSRDEVNFVAARELFNGVGGNQFGVSQPMTRGMVNTVLARLAGVDTTPGQGQAWYEVGTDWAKKNGISDGTNPTAPVTREQLATLLYRYAGSPSVSGTLHAADAASVSDYAEDALLWANQNGIVNGVGSNTIAPKDNAQRAQVAAMLARYLQNQ